MIIVEFYDGDDYTDYCYGEGRGEGEEVIWLPPPASV